MASTDGADDATTFPRFLVPFGVTRHVLLLLVSLLLLGTPKELVEKLELSGCEGGEYREKQADEQRQDGGRLHGLKSFQVDQRLCERPMSTANSFRTRLLESRKGTSGWLRRSGDSIALFVRQKTPAWILETALLDLSPQPYLLNFLKMSAIKSARTSLLSSRSAGEALNISTFAAYLNSLTLCSTHPRSSIPRISHPISCIFSRNASHAAQGRANGPKDSAGRRLGAKKSDSEYVIPGNIIFKQRGTFYGSGLLRVTSP